MKNWVKRNKSILKGVLIGILGFIFGLFTSSRKEPFSSFVLILIVSLILFIKNYKMRIQPLYFWIINFSLFIMGFILGILEVLPFKIAITGPVSALIIGFSFIFILSTIFIFSIFENPEYYKFGYFFTIFFLLMGILFSYGNIQDYMSNNLDYPYNIISPIIIILLWIFTFISFYSIIKGKQKIKDKLAKNK